MSTEKKNEVLVLQPQLDAVVKQSKLELSKAQSHAIKFAPFMQIVNELSEPLSRMNKENPTPEDAKLARETRLKMVPNRTATAEIKATLKEDLLTEGKYIDSLFNVVELASKLTEGEYLAIEKYEERRLAKVAEETKTKRLAELEPFETPGLQFMNLAEMPEDQYQNLFLSSKQMFEQRAENARIAEEKRIEDERVAAETERKRIEEEKAEIERIRIENEKLLKEKEEKEKAAQRGREWQNKLISAGLVYNGSAFVYGDTIVTVQDIIDKSDKDLQKIIDVTIKLVEKSNADAAQKEEQKRRVNEILSLGLTIDAAGGDIQGFTIHDNINAIMFLEAGKYEAWLTKTKSIIEQKKAAAIKKQIDADAEIKRIADEKAAQSAPDKDKINALYTAIKNIAIPELSTPQYKAIGVLVNTRLTDLLTEIIAESKKLK